MIKMRSKIQLCKRSIYLKYEDIKISNWDVVLIAGDCFLGALWIFVHNKIPRLRDYLATGDY